MNIEPELASIAVVIVLTIAVFGLLAAVFVLLRRFQRLTDPVYDHVVRKARAEAEHILDTARREAHKTTQEAERTARTYIQNKRDDVDRIHRGFESALRDLSERTERALAASERAIEDRSQAVADTAEEEIRKAAGSSVNEIREASQTGVGRLEEVFQQTEDEMKRLSHERGERIRSHLSAELEEAKAAIERYKKERMNVVDEHIVTLVERAAQITLNTTLTADDHMEVIKRSLEEAKSTELFSEPKADREA